MMLPPPPPELRLQSLESVLAPLAREAGYTLNLPEKLAGRPVVLHFATAMPAKERLAGLAKALCLDLKVEDDGRTLSVRRDPKTSGPLIEQRIQRTFDAYQKLVQPVLALSPKERYDEATRLFRREKTLAASGNAAEREAVLARANALRKFLDVADEALASEVLTFGPSSLTRLSARPQRRDISPDTRRLLADYLAGRAPNQFDFALSDAGLRGEEPNEAMRPIADGVRESARRLGQGAPLLRLATSLPSQSGQIFVRLRAITPTDTGVVGAETFDLPRIDRGTPELIGSIPGADQELALRGPFRYARIRTTDGFAELAVKGGLDYAGWHRSDKVILYNVSRPTITAIFRSPSLLPPLRVRREGPWLRLERLENPWPEYGADYRALETAQPLVDGPAPTPDALLASLDGLGERQLDDLEVTLFEQIETDPRYRGLTYGVRLLRAALREERGRPFDRPISRLSAGAQADARRFFRGAYVDEYFGWLTHPANAGLLGRLRLQASYAEEDGTRVFQVGLAFPEGQRAPNGFEQIRFVTPIAGS